MPTPTQEIDRAIDMLMETKKFYSYSLPPDMAEFVKVFCLHITTKTLKEAMVQRCTSLANKSKALAPPENIEEVRCFARIRKAITTADNKSFIKSLMTDFNILSQYAEVSAETAYRYIHKCKEKSKP